MKANPQAQNEADRILKTYAHIYSEIIQNKNLEAHLKDVDGAIEEINERINEVQNNPRFVETLQSIKNDLWALKYEILERT